MTLIALLTTTLLASGSALQPSDRLGLSHCGVLLLARSVDVVGNQATPRRVIRQFMTRALDREAAAAARYPYHGRTVGDANAPVRLGVDGEDSSWPRARLMLERSVLRLHQLELDLGRPMDVFSVVTESRRTDRILASLRKNEYVVRNLDAAASDERRARRTPGDGGDTGTALAGVGLLTAGVAAYVSGWPAPSPLAAGVLGVLGAGVLAGPTERLMDRRRALFPVRSAYRDDVGRFVDSVRARLAGAPGDVFAHVGFTLPVSDEFVSDVRQAGGVNDLSADVLLDAEAETRALVLGTDRRARVSVDQVFTIDEDTGEPVVVSVARLRRRTYKLKTRPPGRTTSVETAPAPIGSH